MFRPQRLRLVLEEVDIVDGGVELLDGAADDVDGWLGGGEGAAAGSEAAKAPLLPPFIHRNATSQTSGVAGTFLLRMISPTTSLGPTAS